MEEDLSLLKIFNVKEDDKVLDIYGCLPANVLILLRKDEFLDKNNIGCYVLYGSKSANDLSLLPEGSYTIIAVFIPDKPVKIASFTRELNLSEYRIQETDESTELYVMQKE